MSFQTCTTLFILCTTREDILNNSTSPYNESHWDPKQHCPADFHGIDKKKGKVRIDIGLWISK